jgi:hypothetical protein
MLDGDQEAIEIKVNQEDLQVCRPSAAEADALAAVSLIPSAAVRRLRLSANGHLIRNWAH